MRCTIASSLAAAGFVLFVLFLTLVGPGCGSRNNERTRDAAAQDAPRPDQGFGPCTKKCPPPSGGGICISGRVYELPELAAQWAGLVPSATPLNGAHGAEVQVHDPILLATNPGAPPITKAKIDSIGCFVATGALIPFSGLFLLRIDDALLGKHKWFDLPIPLTPTPGQNIVGLDLPGLPQKEMQAWKAESGLDPLKDGAVISVFLRSNGRTVEGVTPTLAGTRPPWPGRGIAVFDSDLRKPPYFKKGATATTKSGMVLTTKLPPVELSGKKSGCTIEKYQLPGALNGMVMLKFLSVSGC